MIRSFSIALVSMLSTCALLAYMDAAASVA